jgi:hypothetical protein
MIFLGLGQYIDHYSGQFIILIAGVKAIIV